MAKTILSSPMLDIEMLTHEAIGFASLQLWINEARALIDKVRDCARIDPYLADRLKQNNVRILSADWDEDAANGMDHLILRQRGDMQSIRDIAERRGSSVAEITHA